MVVCNFFLQGRCKFGENCRNEHYYPDSSNKNYSQYGYQNPPQYNYRNQGYGRNQPQTNVFQGNFSSQQNRYSVLSTASQNVPQQSQQNQSFDFGKMIQDDTLTWERSGQWPFSCYAPLLRRAMGNISNVNSSSLPGLLDYSPEELRWEAYSSGSLEQYLAKVQLLSQEYSLKRQALQKLDSSTLDFIVRYERGENVSPSGTPLGQASTWLSPPQPVSQPPPGTFKFQLPSVFPQTNQPNVAAGPPTTFGQQAFGNNATAAAPTAFGQQIFGNSAASNPMFASSTVPGSSFKFALPSQPSSQTANTMMNNVSVQPAAASTAPIKSTFSFSLPNMQPPVVQNISTISNVVNTSGPVWGTQPQQFGFSTSIAAIKQDINGSNPAAYSDPGQLSEEDLQQYKAPTFSIGKIPLRPPTREQCF